MLQHLETLFGHHEAEIRDNHAWLNIPRDYLLRSLPFWDVAVETEGYASARIEALARIEPDPLLRDAVAMQGFEEARHKQLIEGMLKTYDISFEEPGEYRVSSDAEWGFMRMGYGECFDSFFASSRVLPKAWKLTAFQALFELHIITLTFHP